MKIVDTKGQSCPAPLIAAKRALRETAAGESFLLLTDNRTSFSNLKRFLTDNKAEFSVEERSGVWEMTIKKVLPEVILTDPDEYCETTITHFEKGNFIVVISSDVMGDGDEVLGKLLIGNFIKALKDLDKLPSKIVFYNKGVFLGTVESGVANHLEDLQKMGVELHFCVTCVNHYNLADRITLGIMSNMFVIAEAMTSGASIIKP